LSPAERCDEILRLIDQQLVHGAGGDAEACGNDDASPGDPAEANPVGTDTITPLRPRGRQLCQLSLLGPRMASSRGPAGLQRGSARGRGPVAEAVGVVVDEARDIADTLSRLDPARQPRK
jgi:hypothetical protein